MLLSSTRRAAPSLCSGSLIPTLALRKSGLLISVLILIYRLLVLVERFLVQFARVFKCSRGEIAKSNYFRPTSEFWRETGATRSRVMRSVHFDAQGHADLLTLQARLGFFLFAWRVLRLLATRQRLSARATYRERSPFVSCNHSFELEYTFTTPIAFNLITMF
jgi:hypothetical protein